MSYGFTVTHDADGFRLEELNPDALAHVPMGRFMVNGHVPGPGMSPIASIGVQLSDESLSYIGGASGNYRVHPDLMVPPLPAAPDA